MASVAAVVLAAGRSSRFRAAGGAEESKLLAEIEGKPIVLLVAETALASRARPVIVVVGHASRAVKEALAGSPVTIAFNPDFETGLAFDAIEKLGSIARIPHCARRHRDAAVNLVGLDHLLPVT